MRPVSEPPPALVGWVNRHLPTVPAWEPVVGATTASVWKVSNAGRSYIVKAYSRPGFVAEYPDCVEHTVRATEHVAGHSDLVVPRVVAVDASGDEAGVPSLIMTAIGGHPLEVPTRRTFDRVIDVAEVIHTIAVGEFPWQHHRYNEPGGVFPPGWFADRSLFAHLVSMSEEAVSDQVFIHRDFHPGNLLLDGEHVTGIIDWDYACVGPSGEDYGRTWLNLAVGYGRRISGVFASRAARRLDPRWVAATWLDWLPYYEGPDDVEAWGSVADRSVFESVGRWVTELG